MITYVLEKILHYFPVFFPYVLVGLILIILTFYATKFYLDTKKVCKDMPSIKDFLQKIDKSLATLNAILIENNVIKNSFYTVSKSPIAVNDLGEELLKKSGADQLMDKKGEEFLAALEQDKFDSLLDVERASIKFMMENMDNPDFTQIQNFVYNNPTFNSTPLNYADILFVMALKLRDKYFEKNSDKFANSLSQS